MADLFFFCISFFFPARQYRNTSVRKDTMSSLRLCVLKVIISSVSLQTNGVSVAFYYYNVLPENVDHWQLQTGGLSVVCTRELSCAIQ